MKDTRTPLDGYKTYIVAAAGIAVVIFLYSRGDLAADVVLQTVLTLLGIGTLRHGIQTGS